VGRVLHQATRSPLAAATCVCLAAHSIYTNDIAVPNDFPDATFCNCLAAACTVSRSSAPQMALRLGNCVNDQKAIFLDTSLPDALERESLQCSRKAVAPVYSRFFVKRIVSCGEQSHVARLWQPIVA